MTIVRRRSLPFGGSGRTFWTRERRRKDNGTWVIHSQHNDAGPTLPSFVGTQVTVSENHSWPPSGGSTSGDVGGPFSTRKSYGEMPITGFRISEEEPYTSSQYDRNKLTASYGLATPIPQNPDLSITLPSAQDSSESSLTALGATAVSRCRPTASAVELSTALGELRKEGLPSLPGIRTWQERSLRASSAGSEYLNAVFGWAPLVDDITKFCDMISKSGSILSQYESDKAKPIRRRYSFPSERVSTTVTLSENKLPWGLTTTGGFSGQTSGGKWVETTSVTRDTWFSGAFAYGVPNGIYSGTGIMEAIGQADRLLGLSLTPDVLWNLTPWSWAIDWFTNTGDVLETLSDFASQGLVMRYGYVMEHVVHEKTYSLTGCRIYGKPVSLAPSRLVTETKTRIKANPFGFGVTWEGLSSSQLAILAALGISRT